MTTLTYRQLQSALKSMRTSGIVVTCKLTATAAVLQAEYTRLTATPTASVTPTPTTPTEYTSMSYTTAVIVSNRINAYLRSDELPEISETLYTVTCYSIGYSIAAIYVAVRFVWQAMQPTFDYDIDNTPATPDLEYTVSLEPLAVGCAPPTQVQPRITVVVDATDVVAPTPTTPTTPTRRRTYSTAHVATVAAFLDALPSR